MKEYFIRSVLLGSFMMLFLLKGVAQDVPKSNHSKWLPDYFGTQYAGSIGAVSLGAGYELGKRKKGHLEIWYGYTPKYDSDDRMSSITVKGLKSMFNGVNISRKHQLKWTPLRLGVGLSYIADNRFFSFRTDLPYPEGYYWHKTGLRAMVLLQSEISLPIDGRYVKEVSYYLEANIQDVYMTLKFADKNFTVADMVKLGMGVRIKF